MRILLLAAIVFRVGSGLDWGKLFQPENDGGELDYPEDDLDDYDPDEYVDEMLEENIDEENFLDFSLDDGDSEENNAVSEDETENENEDESKNEEIENDGSSEDEENDHDDLEDLDDEDNNEDIPLSANISGRSGTLVCPPNCMFGNCVYGSCQCHTGYWKDLEGVCSLASRPHSTLENFASITDNSQYSSGSVASGSVASCALLNCGYGSCHLDEHGPYCECTVGWTHNAQGRCLVSTTGLSVGSISGGSSAGGSSSGSSWSGGSSAGGSSAGASWSGGFAVGCAQLDCGNGNCEMDSYGPYCDCHTGWEHDPNTGKCTVVATACNLNCQNGGSCHFTSQGNMCSCKQGYKGSYCEVMMTCDDYMTWGNAHGLIMSYPCQQSQSCELSIDQGTQWTVSFVCRWSFTGNTGCPLTCVHGSCVNFQTGPQCVCDEGWAGDSCQIRKCNACFNGGQFGSNGQCICTPQATGPCCEQQLCTLDCGGHGRCHFDALGTQSCFCSDGYTGAMCNVPPCNLNCDHGTCARHQNGGQYCDCSAGWSGDFCHIPPCSLNCNNGECRHNDQTYHPYCVCQAGWEGNFCNTRICGLNCGSYGQCYADPQTGSQTCSCFDGYTGNYCQTPPCTLNCGSNGHCRNLNGQECVCTNGYTGNFCTVPPCTLACGTHGRCVNQPHTGQQCQCWGGYEGPSCEIPPCALACGMHGSCNNQNGIQTCVCRDGYTGNFCHIQPCNLNCGPHGTCRNVNGHMYCLCNQFYEGEFCDHLTCNKDCGAHGVCQTVMTSPSTAVSTCQCTDSYTGEYCQIAPCLLNCGQHGTCVNPGGVQACQCYDGYVGDYCNVLPCTLQCGDHGSCVNNGNTQHCECRDEYHGFLCSIPPCNINCGSNGQCMLRNGGPENYCSCSNGYTGDFCQIPPCRRDCQHGGRCIFQSQGVEACSCINGYGDPFCRRPPHCTLTCQNGGTCELFSMIDQNDPLWHSSPLMTYGSRCHCPAAFTGDFCQTAICDLNCGTQGSCQIADNMSKYCLCNQGWMGDYCDTQDPCFENQCQNQCTCRPAISAYECKYTCHNIDGLSFLGAKCEHPQPSLICSAESVTIRIPNVATYIGSQNGLSTSVYLGDFIDANQDGLGNPVHRSWDSHCEFQPNGNGQWELTVARSQIRNCGGHVSLNNEGMIEISSWVWNNYIHRIISMPKVLFEWVCTYETQTTPISYQALCCSDRTARISVGEMSGIAMSLYCDPPSQSNREALAGTRNRFVVGDPIYVRLNVDDIFSTGDLHVTPKLVVNSCYVSSMMTDQPVFVENVLNHQEINAIYIIQNGQPIQPVSPRFLQTGNSLAFEFEFTVFDWFRTQHSSGVTELFIYCDAGITTEGNRKRRSSDYTLVSVFNGPIYGFEPTDGWASNGEISAPENDYIMASPRRLRRGIDENETEDIFDER